jgi:hypothetical protein
MQRLGVAIEEVSTASEYARRDGAAHSGDDLPLLITGRPFRAG